MISYICGNTFKITNTYRFDFDLTWRVVGTEETGGFEAPRLRPGSRPRDVYLTTVEKGTVEVYSRSRMHATARNRGRPACTIPADTVPLEVPWNGSFLPEVPALLFTDSTNPGNRYYGNYLAIQLDSTLGGAVINQVLRRHGMTPLSSRAISTGWPSVTTVRVASRRNWQEFTDFVSRVRADSQVANVAILQFDLPPPVPGQWVQFPGLPPMDASRRVWPLDGMEYFRVDLEVHFRPGHRDAERISWFARNPVIVTAHHGRDHYFIRIPDPGPKPAEYIRAVDRMRRDSVVQQLNPIPLGSVRRVPLAGTVLDEPTARNVKGGVVCLATSDPDAAQCARVDRYGRFTMLVAPARAGTLSWACNVNSLQPGSSPTRQWEAPFTPGESPAAQSLPVNTTRCDATIGTFRPLTRVAGTVTAVNSGRPFERSAICFSWPVNGSACRAVDSGGAFVLDSLPLIDGTLKVTCDSTLLTSHEALNAPFYPDTVAGLLNLVLDPSGCDPRPVRRERRTVSGLYTGAFEESSFVPCPSDSWVQPGDTTWKGRLPLDAWVLWSRWPEATPGEPTAWPREAAYPHKVKAFVRWTGTIEGPGTYGHMGMSPFVFHVDFVVEVRAPRKGDCGLADPKALMR